MRSNVAMANEKVHEEAGGVPKRAAMGSPGTAAKWTAMLGHDPAHIERHSPGHKTPTCWKHAQHKGSHDVPESPSTPDCEGKSCFGDLRSLGASRVLVARIARASKELDL